VTRPATGIYRRKVAQPPRIHVIPRFITHHSSFITPPASPGPHLDGKRTWFGRGFLATPCSGRITIIVNTVTYAKPRPARKTFFRLAKQTQPPLCASVPCMFKTRAKRSTTPLRVRMTTSVARSHANTTSGPRPIVPRPIAAVTEHGPSRSRVASPEQPTEPPGPSRRRSPARSHSQGRDARMTHDDSFPPSVSPQPVSPPIFIGIDVAKHKQAQA